MERSIADLSLIADLSPMERSIADLSLIADLSPMYVQLGV
jgi:hypothetical protein